MLWTTFLLIAVVFILGLGAYLLYIWSVKSGQFDDPEGPKYRIFDEDEED